MQNFAEKDLFFTIFSLFFKKKVFFLTMRAVCMQKNAHFARASDQKRARLKKMESGFSGYGVLFSPRGARFSLTMKEKRGSLP